MKIVVLGSKGMLGSALELRLKGSEHTVVCLSRKQLDLTDREKVLVHKSLRAADVIVNCAAFTEVDKCEDDYFKALEVNGCVPRYISEVCDEVGSLMVQVSTDYVFNGRLDRPYTERDSWSPLNAYGDSKVVGEICALRSERNIIVRTAWLYGPYKENFIFKIVKRASKSKRIEVVSDQFGTPAYTVDLSDWILKLVESGETGIFHGVNDGVASWFEFAKEAIALSGIDCEVIPITSEEAKEKFGLKAERPAYSVLDCGRLKTVVGDVRHWREALKEYLS